MTDDREEKGRIIRDYEPVERNDLFDEMVAKAFGVSPEVIARTQAIKDKMGWPAADCMAAALALEPDARTD